MIQISNYMLFLIKHVVLKIKRKLFLVLKYLNTVGKVLELKFKI